MEKKTNVYIVGAGGFGREIESWAGLSGNFTDSFSIQGYIDDNPDALKEFPSDLKIISSIDDFQFENEDYILLAIVDPKLKSDAIKRLQGRVKILSFVFENVIIGRDVTVGEGSIIGPNCVLTSNINIGNFVTIFDSTTIGHDSKINDFSTILGHVNINGKVNVGRYVVIGNNSSVASGITIADNYRISTGTSVKQDVPDYSFSVSTNVKNQVTQDGINERIWLSPPHMGGSEIEYIHKAFSSNWIAPIGPMVDAFEESIAKFTGVTHVAALNSGTAAIHLALIVLGVSSGDEVIASTLTFSASINPIVYLNATPILVDSEPDTWNMCPETLEMAIRDRLKRGKKPKAIILVHIYGMPAKTDKILEIARKYDIPIIEDAAESLGSTYKDKKLGSFGEIGILSFNGNKIITTSCGGAMISDNERYIIHARFLSKQARDNAPHYEHSKVGYNYRMSNILAGIGLGQMEILAERIIQRKTNFEFYKKNLGSIDGIAFQEEPDESYFSNRWLTTVLFDPEKLHISRDEIYNDFAKNNIESRPLWKPMHLQPVFSSCPSYINGTSEELFRKGLCLPSGSNLTHGDLERIMVILKKCLSRRIYSTDFD